MAAKLDYLASKLSNIELRQSQEASEAMAMVRHIEQFASGEAPNASAKQLKIFVQEAQAEGASSKSPSPSLVSYGSFMARNDSRPDRASHPRTQDPLQRATGKARPETFKPGRELKTSVASATPKADASPEHPQAHRVRSDVHAPQAHQARVARSQARGPAQQDPPNSWPRPSQELSRNPEKTQDGASQCRAAQDSARPKARNGLPRTPNKACRIPRTSSSKWAGSCPSCPASRGAWRPSTPPAGSSGHPARAKNPYRESKPDS